ncbi:hypothetical protein H112_00432 [Trichophyton rubrum D6]|uniref:NAD dependent epimerase/dehydratase n=4 Tax=Trichophyton TaxID=5550 RepID=A0A178FAM5_TRIRU|nr:uncharacterized protein TERG_08048 [Trichophyton rubrum CBS 118892]EZF27590.1 hypothetical protein H100_00431 [Trichophyton rubrum MR850]EZF46625.1 hypothetical protein H102_00431 [Trichophyton rubrum CBS 100081]EZF57288.1 hypothetical protein H103_00431 [Trichophyton rubrum CBS 288.86]EZF67885.1 hypothetical protein H104_00421 [Trichophyton rubrum CBS 289.86]EZF78503.1 hypothetical protein H105_00420 [Trichophyton soudanense CBS 452.61]EZF89140.1 hypothetical protein H110_00435 [Trichophy
MNQPTELKPQRLEMKVLALGLPRSGTLSMANALSILGYQNVHHTLTDKDGGEAAWRIFNRAADATFPDLPTYHGRAFSREQWDEVYGGREAVTEAAALFGPQLIKVYPSAKVILVKRDFDRWYNSLDRVVLQGLWSPMAAVFCAVIQPILGNSSVSAMRKALLGFFQARDVEGIRKNVRVVYDRYYREIEDLVPPGQLLHYRMGQGWEPLCEFLGKPVPDAEFPWANEEAELMKKRETMLRGHFMAVGGILGRWAFGVGTLGFALWIWARKTGILTW